MSRFFPFVRITSLAALVTLSATGAALARDAAFLNPGGSLVGGISEEAIKVDPKAEIEVGETTINVAKRSSIFFVNQTNQAVKIEKVALNNDSLVTAEATSNDCTKQGSIAPLSRCSIEISVTPTSAGAWSVDVLMTHNGAGRITRARLTGKTSGTGAGEGKSTGLSVSAKEIKPIDFGAVDIGNGKIVRSTLMVNDSPEAITIFSIDVIEADNGLQKLEQGCAVDMELAPGASCPVTLLWVPKTGGPISTDLILRHSGKMGFAVIPVRGEAKGTSTGGSESEKTTSKDKNIIPLPPSPHDLEKEVASRIAPISESSLGIGAYSSGGGRSAAIPSGGDGDLHLIGTVGDHALFLLPSGETSVVSTGSEIEARSGTAKLVSVGARSADIVVSGKKRTLPREAASSLVARATEQAKQDEAAQKKDLSSPIGGIKR